MRGKKENFWHILSTSHRYCLVFLGLWVGSAALQAQAKPDSQRPTIALERIVLDEQALSGSQLQAMRSASSVLKLGTAEHLCFEFKTGAPADFSYRLNQEGPWLSMKSGASLHFSHLPSGQHLLQIKNQKAGQSAFSMEFELNQPFYTTYLFYFLVMLVLLSGVYLLIRYRYKRSKKQQEWLQEQIKQRTASLNQINTKLEERQQEMEEQQQELEIYYHQVFQLAEIGQEITSSLDLKEILLSVYNRVNGIMDAAEFAIGFYHPEENIVDYALLVENGKIANLDEGQYKISADDKSKIAVWVIENRQSVLINHVKKEMSKYVERGPDADQPIVYGMPESLIYAPLILKDQVLGVITVQSYHRNVYKQHHLDMLKTIAAYTTIALNNSRTTNQLQQANEELNKLLEKMREQNKLIEKKNTNILDSIQYARRIQMAILPDNQRIKKAFKESFIYFKPKDIISGDFYWFAQKEDCALLAAIDCTGHGVPGAFMSVMANSALNEIINDMGVTSPDRVLDLLERKISTTLKKQSDSDTFNDGMDLGLISYYPKENKLEFAGAKRSLIHIRDGQLQETKGNKYSIGSYQLDFKKEFDKTTLYTQAGDCIYIYTDGYTDQFGGKKSKKFMAARLKRLLSSIADKDLNIQESIIVKELNEWKEGHAQTDDILVVGLRF